MSYLEVIDEAIDSDEHQMLLHHRKSSRVYAPHGPACFWTYVRFVKRRSMKRIKLKGLVKKISRLTRKSTVVWREAFILLSGCAMGAAPLGFAVYC